MACNLNMENLTTSLEDLSLVNDIQIKIADTDRIFTVPSGLLCSKSEYFKAMLNGQFKEATTRIIELHDDDPGDLERMIDFFHTGKYTDIVPGFTHSPDSCTEAQLTNVAMYVIADKYILPALKQDASDSFMRHTRYRCPLGDGVIDLVRAVYTSPALDNQKHRYVICDVVLAMLAKLGRKVPEAAGDVVDDLNGRMHALETARARLETARGQMAIAREGLQTAKEALGHDAFGRDLGISRAKDHSSEGIREVRKREEKYEKRIALLDLCYQCLNIMRANP